jgi:hypothetical protein
VFAGNATAAAIKVAVVLVVRETHDLVTIAIAAVLVVALESFLFIGQLHAVGNMELRQLSMTMLRAAMAAIPTVAILWMMPGTWEHLATGQYMALLYGSGIGAISFILFIIFDATVWILFGKPEGSECRIYDTVRSIVWRT